MLRTYVTHKINRLALNFYFFFGKLLGHDWRYELILDIGMTGL